MRNRLRKNPRESEFTMDSLRPYLLVIIFLFYTLPVVFAFAGEMGQQLAYMQIYALNPIVLFVDTVMFTVKVGINPKFPLIAGGVFIPAGLIFYSMKTGLACAAAYWVISFVGLAAGALVRRFLR